MNNDTFSWLVDVDVDVDHHTLYHVFKKSGRILDRGTTEMDQYMRSNFLNGR